VVRLEGTPIEFGNWGWSREWGDEDLMKELQAQLRDVTEPRVYISHVPPFGSLDQAANGQNIAHRPLFRHLHERNWPKALVLCGHVHESFGSMNAGGTLVVNAACGYALLEWTEGTPTMLAQERLEAGTAQVS
jgi:Icc-related predicted phosphoesterase